MVKFRCARFCKQGVLGGTGEIVHGDNLSLKNGIGSGRYVVERVAKNGDDWLTAAAKFINYFFCDDEEDETGAFIEGSDEHRTWAEIFDSVTDIIPCVVENKRYIYIFADRTVSNWVSD